jgi:hypothetical protein
MMCRLQGVEGRVLRIARSRPSQRAQDDEGLLTRIKLTHGTSNETYGSPRIHAQLRHENIRVGKKRRPPDESRRRRGQDPSALSGYDEF